MPTAYGYVRVSTDGQEESGVGEDHQTKSVLSAYERKLRAAGYEMGEVVRDLGVSCTVPFAHRPGGAKVNVLLRRGDALIVPAIDRAFGDLFDAVGQVQAWVATGVRVVSPDCMNEEIDTESMVGKLFLFMLAWVAEWRIKTITATNQRRVRSMKEQGRPPVAPAPYGLKIMKVFGRSHFQPDDDERKLMGFVVRQRDAGHSFRDIWQHLRKHKVKSRLAGRDKAGNPIGGKPVALRLVHHLDKLERKYRAIEAQARSEGKLGPDDFVTLDGVVLKRFTKAELDRAAGRRYNATSPTREITAAVPVTAADPAPGCDVRTEALDAETPPLGHG